jgi:purine-nucleoside phosphorylase
LKLGDVILAQTASTDSQINRLRFRQMDFAPAADFALLRRAHDAALARSARVAVGGILSSDVFYHDGDDDWWRLWADHDVLGVEMETSALYTIAARLGAAALSVLTVSDDLTRGEIATSEQRERGFPAMAEIALAAVAED